MDPPLGLRQTSELDVHLVLYECTGIRPHGFLVPLTMRDPTVLGLDEI